tara:strand:+ start:13931 stop:14068 length:138 start_codon:yes stop_codon:yes gene_type:complete
MDFQVTVDKWGNYKKGDVLDMHPSTGKACSKVVKPYTHNKKKVKK